MDTAAVAKRKILGVPVLYLIGGFVAIMAVIAWRMKAPAPAAATPAIDPATGQPVGAVAGQLYPPSPVGSVSATTITQPPAEAPYADNNTWLRQGVAWLIANGTNPGDAQLALQHYLDGGNLTYTEGAIRDKVVRQFGLPPDITNSGSTGPAPVPPPAPTPDPIDAPVSYATIPAPGRTSDPSTWPVSVDAFWGAPTRYSRFDPVNQQMQYADSASGPWTTTAPPAR